MMKIWGWIFVGIVAVTAVCWTLLSDTEPEASSSDTEAEAPNLDSRLSSIKEEETTNSTGSLDDAPKYTIVAPTAPPSRQKIAEVALTGYGSDSQSANDDIAQLVVLWEAARRTLRSDFPPISGNRDFVRLLTGQTNQGFFSLLPDHSAINEKGQLLDRWGTPIHLHPVSADRLDFRLAGPDRKLFSNDDVVYAPGPLPKQLIE